MVAFASDHFDLLSQFARRVATGTTGARLNELAWSRGWPANRPWVQRYLSGPLGGDAQIAELVLEHQCHRSEEHTSELQSLMRISYAVFCLKTKKKMKPKANPQRLNYENKTITHLNT